MAAEHVARIGARISELRQERGLTQNQLADLIPGKGTDGNQVSKWERGVHKPTDDTLEHIARALGVDVTHLLVPGPTSAPPTLPQIVGGSQLDRIEAKLDRLLALLGESATPRDAAADLADDALGLLERASEDARQAPSRAARRSA